MNFVNGSGLVYIIQRVKILVRLKALLYVYVASNETHGVVYNMYIGTDSESLPICFLVFKKLDNTSAEDDFFS